MRMNYLHRLVDLATMRLSRGDTHELEREVLYILASSNLDHWGRWESELDLVLFEIIVRNVDGSSLVVDESLAIGAVARKCRAS